MKSTKTPTIIAVTALVVAVLAATPVGQAAGKSLLAKSSIGTTQLKRNAVTAATSLSLRPPKAIVLMNDAWSIFGNSVSWPCQVQGPVFVTPRRLGVFFALPYRPSLKVS